jgi:hypothetical protein
MTLVITLLLISTAITLLVCKCMAYGMGTDQQ